MYISIKTFKSVYTIFVDIYDMYCIIYLYYKVPNLKVQLQHSEAVNHAYVQNKTGNVVKVMCHGPGGIAIWQRMVWSRAKNLTLCGNNFWFNYTPKFAGRWGEITLFVLILKRDYLCENQKVPMPLGETFGEKYTFCGNCLLYDIPFVKDFGEKHPSDHFEHTCPLHIFIQQCMIQQCSKELPQW